jgi:hypothetical protein
MAVAEAPAGDQSFLVPYVGVFDVADSDSLWQFGAEYRLADIGYGFRPTIGANIDDESDVYVYGGLNWDLPLGYNFVFTPNFMVGYYDDASGGKDLGGAIEFRSGLELSYAFENQSRVGVAFNHISNASIYDRNPGAETLLINYHIPMRWLQD